MLIRSKSESDIYIDHHISNTKLIKSNSCNNIKNNIKNNIQNMKLNKFISYNPLYYSRMIYNWFIGLNETHVS